MMGVSFLRTIPTARLVALCASAAALAAGGTAIALAGGSGPTPPAKPLAAAVHDGLTAPATQGVTARVKFTNHLVDSSGIHGANPLLSGATGRLWLSPGRGLRLELQSDGSADSQIVANRTGFWVLDGTSNTVYKGALPADRGHENGAAGKQHKVPSVARIQQGLNRARNHKLDISGPVPGNIAGQPAYTVRVGPGQPGGLLGAVELAWDAARGLPLRVAVYARGNSDPVLELTATEVQYGPVADSTFSISPPADAKVVDVGTSKDAKASGKRHGADKAGRKGHRGVSGRAAVARQLPFTLSAPDTLAGLKRSGVHLLPLKKGKAALVTYGNGPGTIAVIERAAKADKQQPAQPKGGEHHGQLELPTVNVNGATARVIDTPLGSVVSFDRAGVSYTVLGSVPAAVAESAARGL
jgi:outer membrane lipoprotein-sorting protein